MYLRYALAAVAAARLAFAGSCDGDLEIASSEDATPLAACKTYTGSITISKSAASNVTINTLKAIDGSLTVIAADNLGSLGADSLESISGTFKLQGVRQLTSLNFPQLTDVGTISWKTLPALNGLTFTSGLTKVDSVSITDTQLQDLSGFSLQEVDSLEIQNNGILTNVSFDLEKINTQFTLSANGDDLTLSLPSLTEAGNMILQGCGSIDLPSLETVTGALDVEDGSYETLDLPKLTEVSDTLTIRKDDTLTGIKLPKLKTCGGGFVIAGNDKLKTINGLDNLQTISGNLDFTGDFNKVNLPKLNSVKGAFNMQSREDIQQICDDFEGKSGRNQAIRGKFTCESKDSDPTQISDGGDNGDNTDFAGALNIPTKAAVAMTGLLAIIISLL